MKISLRKSVAWLVALPVLMVTLAATAASAVNDYASISSQVTAEADAGKTASLGFVTSWYIPAVLFIAVVLVLLAWSKRGTKAMKGR